jgi:hypothetical protein
MRIPMDEVTPNRFDMADVILAIHPSLPDGCEQLWADRDVPKVPPWPEVPYSMNVLEVTLNTSDRQQIHKLQDLVKKVKGSRWLDSPATAAGDLENGAIRLISHSLPPHILDEFRRLFGRGFACLRPENQADIKGYWRKATAPERCRGMPNVKEQYDPNVTVRPSWGVPKTSLDGHFLYFPIPALADMGEELAVVAIAHELAHVTFFASGEPNHWPDTHNRVAYAEAERLVDARLLEWNIQEGVLRRLDQWLADRRFKRI